MLLPLASFCAGLILAWLRASILWSAIPFLLVIVFIASKRFLPLQLSLKTSKMRAGSICAAMTFMFIGHADGLMHFPQYADPENEPNGKYVIADIVNVDATTTGDKVVVSLKSYIGDKGITTLNVSPKAVITYNSSRILSPGDRIVFPFRLRPLSGNDSLSTNTYKKNLMLKGTFYRLTLRDDDISIIRHSSNTSTSKELKTQLLIRLEKSHLSREAAQLVETMLLGEKKVLNDDVRRPLADAGISHILALSGLHTGIICAIVLAVLLPLGALRRNRCLRLAITIAVMWMFAWFTGMSASVVRACVMISFLFAGRMLQRRNSAFNALCGAALIILIVDPTDIFDIGFQLSFTCVGALIIFAGNLKIFKRNEKPLLYKATQGIAACLTATAASWAIVAHHFGIFPLTFLPANLIVLPILPVWMSISLLYVVGIAFNYEILPLTEIINISADALIAFSKFISWEGRLVIYPEVSSMSMYAWWLASGAAAFAIFSRKHRRSFVFAAACLAIFSVCIPIFGDSSHDELIIQNRIGKVGLSYISRNAEHEITMPFGRNSACTIRGKRIIFIDRKATLPKTACDILIIGPSYNGNAAKLLENIKTPIVVLHSSIFSERANNYRAESEAMGALAHDLRSNGPLSIPTDS